MTAAKFVSVLPLPLVLLPAMAAAAGTNLDVARQLNRAFIEVAENASPAVVVITVKAKPAVWSTDSGEGATPPANPFSNEFWRQFHQQFQEEMPEENQGSGVIIRQDGYLLTSRHVVENAEQMEARLRDGRTFKARLRGADPQTDLAVLKIDADNLPVARLADSSKIRVGEFAIAIGAPFNYDYSVTFGHVSAKGRSNVVPLFEGGGSMDQDFIQTDANINPGNSGGPLLNLDGEVIGINTMIRGLHTGIGFAIPSNLAKEVADQLIAEGKFTRAWLGVGIRTLKDDPDFQAATKGVDDGVIVHFILPNGPAAKANVRPGDVITAVDGKAVATVQQLKNEVRGKKIGQDITLDVFRGGAIVQLKIKPGEYVAPPTASAPARSKPETPPTTALGLGLTVRALTPELAEQFGAELTEGVIVVSVDRDSPAARKGIKPGDVITAINRRNIASPEQFQDALKNADLKKGVIVNLLNPDSARFEILKAD